MIDHRHAETVLHAYFRAETAHDKPAWMALFAPEIVFEDPVGARAFNGLEGLERFWAGIADKQIRASTTAPVIVCGNEAVAIVRCEIGPEEAPFVVEPIVNNLVFDEHGKIIRMRAFYTI